MMLTNQLYANNFGNIKKALVQEYSIGVFFFTIFQAVFTLHFSSQQVIIFPLPKF